MLYLIPPGETAKNIYEITGNKMIGIFVPLEDIRNKKGPPTNFLEEHNIPKPKKEEEDSQLDIDLDNIDQMNLEELINPYLLSKSNFHLFQY